jgi:hypothetical protein
MAASAYVRPPDWTDQSGVLIKFRLRLEDVASSYMMYADAAGGTSYPYQLSVSAAGTITVIAGAKVSSTTADMDVDTDYYVWWRIYTSTGTDGKSSIGFATTDSEPTSGNSAFAKVEDHTRVYDIGRLRIRGLAAPIKVIDDVQVTAWNGTW